MPNIRKKRQRISKCGRFGEVRRKDKATRRDKEGALPFADEILVTKAFLEDKQAALLDFERQVIGQNLERFGKILKKLAKNSKQFSSFLNKKLRVENGAKECIV